MQRDAQRGWGSSSWRFVVVGCSNAIIGYSVFRLCLAAPVEVPFKAGLAQILTYAVGICWSFWWNRRWTFRVYGPVAGQAVKFTLLQASLGLASAAAISLAVDVWGRSPTPAWLVVMAVVTILNYLLSRFWAFS